MYICKFKGSGRIVGVLFFAFSFLLEVEAVKAQNAGRHMLWQIGKQDHDMQEFALAPGRFRAFKKDPFFIIGRSHEITDWTYCHPGPDDDWAGGRQHSFSVLFGLKTKPANGECSLMVGLVDAGRKEVNLSVRVNGKEYPAVVPEGNATAIYGTAGQGKKYAFEIKFPADLLIAGNNNITITNEQGSWLLYDWLGVETPLGINTTAVTAGLALAGVQQLPFITTADQHAYQSAELSIVNSGEPTVATISIKGLASQRFNIATGQALVQLRLPEVTKDSTLEMVLFKDHQIMGKETVILHPVRKMTIYVLPHSHNDLGYTEIQTEVEKKQINNLLTGIEYAKKTRDYPEGARFVWNLEGSYAADLFMQRMNEEQKKDLYDAVKDGGVAFNGMYVNTLTGLCRPEELLNLFRFSTSLSKKFGVQTDAAMISDVPGYTWGTVSAMAQAGIKYFSAAPNFFDRIGDILQQWQDKPFYWVSPSGKEKVLVWIPFRGYALSHGISHPSAEFVSSYMRQMEDIHFPYDISYIRWSGHGDNAVPDPEISEFVKEWNTKYTWPHFVISSTSKAFHAFEDRYGSQLPQFSGDWTGYWEDGAGSSAFETSENRTTSSRLTQAETMWALTSPDSYPVKKFEDAWRHVILYSEHTWGADNSVTDPLSQKAKEQWEIKKSYATIADQLSQTLLADAAGRAGTGDNAGKVINAGESNSGHEPVAKNAIEVFNTNSWQRTSLAIVASKLSAAGDVVKDAAGNVIPSQRLTTGELVFIARDLPAFAARKYIISAGHPGNAAEVHVAGNVLDNGIISVAVDETTGAIKSIRNHTIDNNFSDSANGNNLNDYLFLPGKNLADLKRNGPVKISVKEKGPVLSTLLITSSAPGCKSLTREIRLVNGMEYVEITNLLDKLPAELNPHPGDYAWANTGGKESVHFGFPFHVDGGEMRLDIPMAIMRPEKDQIPGSCKNWLETGSWADVSNHDLGITWATLDAPLVEVGEISAILLGGQSNPEVWRKKIAPTQKLYSWALNNHWETNYRASQEGLIAFRYALRPHGVYDPSAATKFATGLTQPLIVAPGNSASSNGKPAKGGSLPAGTDLSVPALTIGSDKIVALVLKPSEDGKAYILTLFNPSTVTESANLQWSLPVGAVFYSNTGEASLQPVTGAIAIPSMEVVTLRVERRPG